MNTGIEQAESIQKEILFENVITPTKEVFREYSTYLLYGRVVLWYIMSLVMAFISVVSLYVSLPWLSDPFEWAGFVFWLMLSVFCFFLVRFGRWRSVNAMVKQEQLLGSGMARERRYRFYDDSLTSPDMMFLYEDILVVLDADLCVQLELKNSIVAIKKDSFVKGDYETFIAFLRKKMGARQHLVKTYRKKRNRIIWIAAICGTIALYLVLINLLGQIL